MILSVITPCFNSEKTIERTLNSFLNLEIIMDKVQIIIVNDGSTDSTLKKVNFFFKSNNFNYIIHNQKNLGLSIARNNGLKIASGKYIWFVDSDDEISINNLMSFNNILQNNFDIFSFPVLEFGKTEKLIPNNFDDKARLVGAPYYIFNRKFLLDNCLYFLSGLIHEDLEFMPRVIGSVKSHLHINFCSYKRIITQGSLTTSKVKLQRLTSLIDICILHLKKNNSNHFGFYSIIALNSAFRLCFSLSFKDFKLFCNYIRPRLFEINPILKVKEKYLIKIKVYLAVFFFNSIKFIK